MYIGSRNNNYWKGLFKYTITDETKTTELSINACKIKYEDSNIRNVSNIYK